MSPVACSTATLRAPDSPCLRVLGTTCRGMSVIEANSWRVRCNNSSLWSMTSSTSCGRIDWVSAEETAALSCDHRSRV